MDQYVKVHKIISPTCFIGLRGTEKELKLCTETLKATPYDLTQASPKTLKSDQQVACFSSIGWARGQIKNKRNNHTFQVQLMDYLDDKDGAPLIKDISWESIRILPRHLTTDKIPKLAGVFYLVDETEGKVQCDHIVDKRRLSLLLERMLESDDAFRCRIVKPLDPLRAVIELHIDLPLNGFLNGKFEIPFIKGSRRDQFNLVNSPPWLLREFNQLRDEIINEDDPLKRQFLMEKVGNLLIGSGPDLEELDIYSDDEFEESVPMKPNDFIAPSSHDVRPSSTEFSASPYRKSKVSQDEFSPSRKQQQGLKKKQRKKHANHYSGNSSCTTGSDSPCSDLPSQYVSSKSDSSNTGGIPIEFLRTEYFHCGDCGLSVSRDHKCPRKGLGNRRLEDMWGRNK